MSKNISLKKGQTPKTSQNRSQPGSLNPNLIDSKQSKFDTNLVLKIKLPEILVDNHPDEDGMDPQKPRNYWKTHRKNALRKSLLSDLASFEVMHVDINYSYQCETLSWSTLLFTLSCVAISCIPDENLLKKTKKYDWKHPTMFLEDSGCLITLSNELVEICHPTLYEETAFLVRTSPSVKVAFQIKDNIFRTFSQALEEREIYVINNGAKMMENMKPMAQITGVLYFVPTTSKKHILKNNAIVSVTFDKQNIIIGLTSTKYKDRVQEIVNIWFQNKI